MEINWFPGHMYKTLGELKGLINVIDFGIIIIDARIPKTSLNKELLAIFNTKPLLVIFNKCDLADQSKTKNTFDKLRANNIYTIKINAQTGEGINNILKVVEESILKEKIIKLKNKGVNMKPYKTIIIGIPNSGKSSLVNRLTKKNKVVVKNMPGTTKNISWLKAGEDFLILDTPGLLWPKLNPSEQLFLAYTGAIPKHVIVPEELAYSLTEYLLKNYQKPFLSYYDLQLDLVDINEIYQLIAKKNGLLLKKGEIDYHRLANKILDDFNNNKFGGISFEEI